MTPSDPPPNVTVAAPLLDEAALVDELVARVGAVLDSLPGGPHAILVVDDGSTDGTSARLADLAEREPRLCVIELSRTFGHQAALTAALDHARGDVVVLMDGDLQDPPEAIPGLLAKLAEGYEVVYATRAARREPWPLRCAYWLAYRLLALNAEVRLPLDAGDFAALSRPAVDALREVRESHRYLRGLRAWVGFRQVGVPVERAARSAGRSKYTWSALARLALNGLFAFSTVPLRAVAALGCAAVAASGAFGVYAVWVKLASGRSPQGFTALLLATVFLSGVQLLSLGVIGEYLGRVYDEVKRRPPYVIRRVLRPPGGLE